MVVSNETLTTLANNLGQAIEQGLETGKKSIIIGIPLETAQAYFAITQELIAFRIDYPDVVYTKAIEDEYGVRGEQ